MPDTPHAFGDKLLSYGPGRIYWDTASGGDNIDLGETDSIVVTLNVSKIELRTSQAGDRPADRAVSAQVYQVRAGLARATAERLAKIVQGFKIETNSAGEIVRIWGSKVVGQRDSSIWKQLTFKEYEDGVPSTDPLRIVNFPNAAPMTESTELTYDATTQRFYGVMFEVYESEDHLDPDGKPTYWFTDEVV